MLKHSLVVKLCCVAVVATSALLLPAGCGGGEETTASSSAQSKTAFINAADALCIRENAQIRSEALKYQEEHGISDDPKKQEELILAIIVPAMQNQVEGLSKMDPPSEDQEKAEAFIEQFENTIAATEDEPPLVLQKTGPYRELRAAGAAFGFRACGQ
jgi:hypothetical protein